MALVSIPGSETSLTSAGCAEPEDTGSGTLALESRQLDQPPAATARRSSATIWAAIRKAHPV